MLSTGTFSSLLSRLAWTPYYASTPRRHSSTRIKFPSIISSLDTKFELEVNEWCSTVTKATKEWMESQVDFSTLRRKTSHTGTGTTTKTGEVDVIDSTVVPNVMPGLLAAMAFPFADYTQLRVCADCLQWMFLLQWWAFEGSLLFEYEDGCLIADTQISMADGLTDSSAKQHAEGKIEDGLSKLLDSVLTRIPDNFLGAVRSSLILYCDRLAMQSVRMSSNTKGGADVPRTVSDARQQVENFMVKIPKRKTDALTSFPWSTPLFALLDFAHDFSDSMDDKYTNAVKSAGSEILQWTHDMLSFTSALCSSSDPTRRMERYDSWLTMNTLLQVCEAQQRTSLLSKMGLTSPPLGPLSIEALQQAVDTLGARILQRIEDLHALRPGETDGGDNARYWRAVVCLVTGVLHWSFQSENYFRPTSLAIHVAMHGLVVLDNFHILSKPFQTVQ